ncbi:MAG: penicillin-binding protein 2 [Alphaproteobacteria bacterium]|nr:penicillin-binding protein 2 [Alphaproteobacteria bacterium]
MSTITPGNSLAYWLTLANSSQLRSDFTGTGMNLRAALTSRMMARRRSMVSGSSRPRRSSVWSRSLVSSRITSTRKLGRLLPDTLDRRRAIIRDVNAAPRFSPVPVKSDLTWEEFAKVNQYANELPGVMVDMNEARYYPFGGAFAHVVGYVAKVSDRDVKAIRDAGKDPPEMLFNPAFRIGKQGVEKALDEELRGVAGGNRVEVDARGRVVAEDVGGSRPAVPGAEVVLTLDADVQNRALEVMGDESGSCVVMDVRNGDILCMVSSPSFDPNLFVSGVPTRIYRALADYERKPLLDKALGGTFPPGSTFKPTTALALLAAGIDPKERVVCTGGYRFGNRVFRCWKAGGHGPQDMHDAIKNSCDVYFYHLCNRAGIDTIHDTAVKLGFATVFDIGIPGQRKGLIPSKAWKKHAYRNRPNPDAMKWQPGETLSVAIGQGAIETSALQLCVATARIANGKKALNPRLIKSVGGVDLPPGDAVPDLPIPKEHLDIVRAGMAAVANDVTGGAYRQSQLGLGDVLMAGKTGTAQARDYKVGESRKNAGLAWGRKDHNLYIAFAPYDAPRYALAVIVQHGGISGALAAAPRAREIMRTVLLKDPEIRARVEKPLPLPDIQPDAEIEGVEPDAPVDVPVTPEAPQ